MSGSEGQVSCGVLLCLGEDGLVVDRRLSVAVAVTALSVVEAVDPVRHFAAGLGFGLEAAFGEQLELEGGEETLGRGVDAPIAVKLLRGG